MKRKLKAEELDATSSSVQYVFIDIVEFTLNRTIESQLFIINRLNCFVEDTLALHDVLSKQKTILLPTGDGLCVAFLNRKEPYDLPLIIALDILKKVHQHNNRTRDQRKKFQLRTGINENQDLLFRDINNKLNLAGAGINIAQRLMNLGDSAQIIVGERIYSKLVQYEEYSDSFKSWLGKSKHDSLIPFYQYQNLGFTFLNNKTPSRFKYQPIIFLNLYGRKWVELPEIIEPKEKGKVVVDIIVDKIGKVISSIPGGVGSTTMDSNLYKIAKEATLSTTFNKISNLETQKGTITFNFV